MSSGRQEATDADELVALVIRCCGGDEEAWQRLWQRLDPVLAATVRRFNMGRISHEEDERRAVVLEVMDRLRDADFRRLRLYVESRRKDPNLPFLPWLKVVARRVAIDHLRAHPNYVEGKREGGARQTGAWQDPASLPQASLLPGVRPAMTRDGTAREMLEHAQKVLPPAHYRALELKVQGEDAAAIAAALGLADEAEAERIVRAAFERLRRKFRSAVSENP